jgi:hypothetical protein
VDEARLADASIRAATRRSVRGHAGIPKRHRLVRHAESGDGCWTFKRTGFLQTRATVRRCGNNDDVAAFDHGMWASGGVVVLPDGRRYRADTNLWSTRFAIATEAGEPLVRFRVKLDGMQVSSVMAIEARARDIEEIPRIAMLGWYIAAQLHRDSALRISQSRRSSQTLANILAFGSSLTARVEL